MAPARALGGGQFVAIPDAETTATIDDIDTQPIGTKRPHHIRHAPVGCPERRGGQDLAADMHGQPDGDDIRQVGSLPVERGRFIPGDAEFISGTTGADLVVRAGLHVRIYTQGDPCRRAERASQRGKTDQFLRTLDIDLPDPLDQREFQFSVRLADAGENDPIRPDARRQRPMKLTTTYDICTAPFSTKDAECCQMVVRLHRVMKRDIQPRYLEGRAEITDAPAKGPGAGHPARRSQISGKKLQRNIFEQEAGMDVHAQ